MIFFVVLLIFWREIFFVDFVLGELEIILCWVWLIEFFNGLGVLIFLIRVFLRFGGEKREFFFVVVGVFICCKSFLYLRGGVEEYVLVSFFFLVCCFIILRRDEGVVCVFSALKVFVFCGGVICMFWIKFGK